MNYELNPNIETVFFMTNHRFSFLSSSIVKEAAKYDASIEKFVPEPVAVALRKKMSETS